MGNLRRLDKPTAELIAKHVNGPPHLIVDAIWKYQDIIDSLDKIAREKKGITEAYEKEMGLLDAKREAVRKTCGHPNIKKHVDPCGDSYRECLICGQEL